MRGGNSEAMDTGTLIAVLAPLIILEVVLLVAALYDLTRPNRRVRGDSKAVWALIIIFVTTIGPILYFLAGREPE
jgi:Phospholipase_D-nuclease N-terminal